MRIETLRNVAIVVALAAIVAFVPSGDESANFVGNVISIAITILFLLLGMRLYQMFRSDIHGLGDRWRGVLYGAIGVAVFAMAARQKLFDTGAGTFAWFALMGAASYALYAVWRQYRSYRI
jgi:predicted Na+-dependent transporter